LLDEFGMGTPFSYVRRGEGREGWGSIQRWKGEKKKKKGGVSHGSTNISGPSFAARFAARRKKEKIRENVSRWCKPKKGGEGKRKKEVWRQSATKHFPSLESGREKKVEGESVKPETLERITKVEGRREVEATVQSLSSFSSSTRLEGVDS